jgi:bacterioferritin
MKGNAQVIDLLNAGLKSELTAISQYVVHSEMCDLWGYERLAKITKAHAVDEMKHAEKVLERILFLEGTPELGMALKLTIGADVKAQLTNDLKLEMSAVASYNEAAQKALELGDNTTRELVAGILHDEEGHVLFLEAQLDQMKGIGVENYLAAQLS